jgi:hypothetical protein
MLLHEFKYQEKQKKTKLLIENGVFLANRFIPGYQLLLFAVDSFYVEVHFDLEHQLLSYFKAFSTIDELEPYLHQIDLSPLVFNC